MGSWPHWINEPFSMYFKKKNTTKKKNQHKNTYDNNFLHLSLGQKLFILKGAFLK